MKKKHVLCWIVLAVISLASLAFSIRFSSEAFPSIELQITMDRANTLKKAQETAKALGIGPQESMQVAIFQTDSELQSYVELKVGGKAAWSKIVNDPAKLAYSWKVRRFQEGNPNESNLYFAPNGDLLGFYEHVAEDEKRENLATDAARVLAKEKATLALGINFDQLSLIESSQNVHPNGRIDHYFVFEDESLTIGDAKYRVQLIVSGDAVSAASRYYMIPEAFTQEFLNMRTANENVSRIGFFAYLVLIVFGGCVVGSLLLYRQGWLQFRQPLILAAFVALLQLAASMSSFEFNWLYYDTALSSTEFLTQQILHMLLSFFWSFVGFSFVIGAAEGLGRRAFSQHIQFFRVFTRTAGSSSKIWGQAISGYLLVGIFLAYSVCIYWLGGKYLGWWFPTDMLFRPNILAAKQPWVIPVANAFQAGLLEECLFRAIPLSIAAIIGRRLNKTGLFIAIGFVLQAVIFGAMHASYPIQPGYARLVELILPSFLFGALYLAFGLLPGIILHFIYDLVLMSMPIFIADFSGVWINQILIIAFGSIPLIILLCRRFQARSWSSIPPSLLNKAFRPHKHIAAPAIEPETKKGRFSRKMVIFSYAFGLFGIFGWSTFSDFRINVPEFSIDSHKAEQIATKNMQDRGVDISEFKPLTSIEAVPSIEDLYVWSEFGRDVFEELHGTWLTTPRFRVRYAKFSGDVAERAEQFQVFIDGSGNIIQVDHTLFEAQPGSTLNEEQARKLAHKALSNTLQINPHETKEISAVPFKLPNRGDWRFVFALKQTPEPLPNDAARISITLAGDEIVSIQRFVHIPETWLRSERQESSFRMIATTLCSVLLISFMAFGFIWSIRRWKHGKYSMRGMFVATAVIAAVSIASALNAIPGILANFPTHESFQSQLATSIAFMMLSVLFFSFGIGTVFGAELKARAPGRFPKNLNTVFVGISWGFGLVATYAAIFSIGQPAIPSFGQIPHLGYYAPLVVGITTTSAILINRTVVLILTVILGDFITQSWQRRRLLFSMVIFALSLAFEGYSGIPSIQWWLILGLASGLVTLLFYVVMLRRDHSLAPLIIGGQLFLLAIGEGLSKSFPGAFMNAIFSGVLVLALSTCCFLILNRSSLEKT